MLLEFSVENYRSIAERQKLSMVAGTGASRSKRYSQPTNNTLAPHVLRSVCLFGPNASGKTSLVRAFSFFSSFVVESAKGSTSKESIDVTPFKLDNNYKERPSEFEVIFVHKEALYQYGYSVDSKRVWSEWLLSKPNKPGLRMRELYSRNYVSEKGEYEWYINEAQVKGERETWKKATRSNALFLSTAILLNTESEVLKAPFEWIQVFLRTISSSQRLMGNFSAKNCLEESEKQAILDLIQSTDIDVQDLLVHEEETSWPEEIEEMFREDVFEKMKGQTVFKVKTIHTSRQGDQVELDLHEESDGTQVLFGLAGPWLDVLRHGFTLVIDELSNSLHPMALRHLVDMFHDPSQNKKGAQLIFTSHESSVMANDFMHRDQIWLVEKNEKSATHIYPLSDFKLRDTDSFQKSYLSGKYGALPRIRDMVHVEE